MSNRQPVGIYLYVPWVFDRLGGVDIIVDQLFFALSAEGHDVHIAEQSWEGYTEWEDSDGRRFVKINFVTWETAIGVIKQARRILSFLRHSLATLFHLKKNHIRVVNAHFPTKHLFMICLIKRLGLWRGRVVLSFHGSDVNDLDFQYWIWRFIMNQADAITTCSQALKSKLELKIGIDHYPVQVVYNGIDTQKLISTSEDPRFAFNKQFNGDYLICLANFVPNKGQDVLLIALTEIRATHPSLNLVLAGGYDNGKWAQQLETQVLKLGISNAVHFIYDVPHEKVPAMLKGAKVMILPSHYESFGLVILEAGILETPIVACDTGGIPEIIPSSEYGELVPPGDAGRLVSAINKVLTNYSNAMATAELFKERIEQSFTREQMCEEYIQSILI